MRSRVKGRVFAAPVALALLVLGGEGHVTPAQKRTAVGEHGATASRDWQTFTGPDREFTLNFPGRLSRAADDRGPVTAIRSYELTTRDGMDFVINFQDTDVGPSSREYGEWGVGFEAALADSMCGQGQRVVSRRRLAGNIVEDEAWKTVQETGAELKYLSRHVLRRGRTHLLTRLSLVDGREMDRPVCRRFFSSLRFSR